MDRRQFVTGLFGSASVAAACGAGALTGEQAFAGDRASRPNVVLMLVDDLGWGDFGCYGSTFHETPNIDRLAREGMKFTNAYAGAPVCSPSRASILTGQVPARLELTQWIPGTEMPNKKLREAKFRDHLERGTATIASELRKLGYQTAAIGKWHLGGEGSLPEDFGFDVNVAGDGSGHPGAPHGYFGPFHYHHLEGYSEADNLTEVLDAKVDEYLGQAAKKGPFFLYLAEYAVHIPLQERKALVQKYRDKNGGRSEPDPVYAAMVESVDTALGRLRARLEALGVAQNTIIVLTSDNGGVGFQGRSSHRIADNGPLHGGKGYLYEGGIREPLIVHWPGVTKAGSQCHVTVWGPDFFPTILALAGGGRSAPDAPADGRDISGLFRGVETSEPRTLCWHYPHYSDQGGTPTGAIREGDWKLMEFFEDGHLELYNLVLDPGEQYDFSSTYSERAADLHGKLVRWRASVRAAMPTRNPKYDPLASPVGAKRPVSACRTVPETLCSTLD